MTESNIENQNNQKTIIPKGILFVRRVFVFLAVFWVLAFMMKTLRMESKIKLAEIEIVYNILINSIALFGLYKRKGWFIPFILIYSAWNFVVKFLHVIAGSGTDIKMIGMKFGNLIIASLYLYLIAYFRRKDARQYFKTDGQILV